MTKPHKEQHWENMQTYTRKNMLKPKKHIKNNQWKNTKVTIDLITLTIKKTVLSCNSI